MLNKPLLTVLISLLAAPLAAAQRYTRSGSYAPSYGACPSTPLVRPASSGLAPAEVQFLSTRREQVKCALEEYLERVAIPDFDVGAYIACLAGDLDKVPVMGLTFSGGGERSLLSSYGLYRGLDGRVEEARKAGTGGLLQAMTYVTGLSGGSFAAAGLAVQGYPTLDTLIASGNLNNTANQTAFAELAYKAELGFPITVADLIGINQVTNLLEPLDGSQVDPLAWTWSGVQEQEGFKNGSQPLTILMAVEVVPPGLPGYTPYQSPQNGTILLPTPGTSTVYEISPYEFGSWSGRVQAFTPTKYLGTNLTAGQAFNETCVTGLDTAVFTSGLSSSAANFWAALLFSGGTVGQFAKRANPYPPNEAALEQARLIDATAGFVEALPAIVAQFPNVTVADVLYGYILNPFLGYAQGAFDGAADQPYLAIVDGSETGQNNPIWPLLRKERAVEFMVVSDNAGTELSTGWMNGTSLLNTYNAALSANLAFPKIPSVNTILNMNFTSRPVFFGCYEQNVPIVLYVADFPWSSYTNISFTQTGLSTSQVIDLTSNGLPLISQNADEEWTTCVACMAIYRSLQRSEIVMPQTCEKCVKRYCWDGSENDAQPGFLDPVLVLTGQGYEEWNRTVFSA